MLHPSGLDANLRASDGRETDERSDFDVIWTDAMSAATDGPPTVNRYGIRAYPLDLCPERAEKVGKVLHVWLGRGVPENRGAPRGRRGHQRVLRRRDAGPVSYTHLTLPTILLV